jgi:hypothetical protein
MAVILALSRFDHSRRELVGPKQRESKTFGPRNPVTFGP